MMGNTCVHKMTAVAVTAVRNNLESKAIIDIWSTIIFQMILVLSCKRATINTQGCQTRPNYTSTQTKQLSFVTCQDPQVQPNTFLTNLLIWSQSKLFFLWKISQIVYPKFLFSLLTPLHSVKNHWRNGT